GGLGGYVRPGLGVLGLAWQSSPALTEVEEVVTDWMRGMLGLSDAWSGVIQDTASTSTLIALICARERVTQYGASRGGLQAEPRPLIVYTSAHSHSSVEKAALLAGFGRANVRIVSHDERYAMRAEALAEAIAADLHAGATPCAIVATSGSTTSTALDPIDAIAALAMQHKFWLHVDAAMAGSAMVLPECRWMWTGIEGARSGPAADAMRTSRAGRCRRRRARSTHAGVVRSHQPVGRRLSDPGDARRPLDGTRVDRRGTDGTPSRREAMERDAHGGG